MSGWIKLAKVQNESYSNAPLLKINEKEFVNSRCWGNNRIIDKYNIDDSKWDQWIKLPKDLSVQFRAAYDQQKQILFISSYNCLSQINILNHLSTITFNNLGIGSIVRCLLVNNQLHIIGHCPAHHSIWNSTQNKFHQLYQFPVARITDPGFVHIKSSNTLLVIGGYDSSVDADLDTIYSYDITKKNWKILPQKLPVPLSSFGCILTQNDRYMVIFGGTSGDDWNQLDIIYVLNIETMQFRKSYILCPETSNFSAINMYNRNNSEILAFGYIKYIWNLLQLSEDIYPPHELIKVIGCFYCTEYVYLSDLLSKKCWKIELDEIMRNCV